MLRDYDLPPDFFVGDSEAERKESQLVHREQVVSQDLVIAFQAATVPAAGEHLQGCAKRLAMMAMARQEIADTPNAPVNHARITVLNIFLNSFYLNLLGALHNVAWAATYELKLLPHIDESASESRNFADFGRREFRKSLKPWPELRNAVAPILGWLQTFKLFRDPAAHRIPLSMPPAVMSAEEGKEWQRLWSERWSATLAGDQKSANAMAEAADSLGEFKPWLESPRTPSGGLYVVPSLMASDEQRFLDFIHCFVPAMMQAAAAR